MKPSRIANVLDSLLPVGEPVLLKGPPGVGKTSLLLQAAQRLGMHTIVCHPVVEDPTDWKGFPFITVDADGKRSADFHPFGNLQRMIDAEEPTLVILDDLGQAPPSVQAAAMQPLGARSINGKAISPHVTFAAATNRRGDNAAVTGLIAPLLDRFTTGLDVDFDVDDYVRWLIENDYPAVLGAFARFRPTEISTLVINRDMNKFATPRSVAAVGRLVRRGLLDVEVLAGAAGTSFATEFTAFHEIWKDLPDRNAIYLNPDAVPVPESPATLYALMGSLAHGVNEVNIDQTVRYLERVRPEFQVVCMKDASVKTQTIQTTNAFAKWMLKNREVFGFEA